jgi:hypothetical protein
MSRIETAYSADQGIDPRPEAVFAGGIMEYNVSNPWKNAWPIKTYLINPAARGVEGRFHCRRQPAFFAPIKNPIRVLGEGR